MAEKEHVIEEMSKKMEADIMASLGVKLQADQLTAEVAKLKKENTNYKAQLEEAKATLEALAPKKKEKKGIFGKKKDK